MTDWDRYWRWFSRDDDKIIGIGIENGVPYIHSGFIGDDSRDIRFPLTKKQLQGLKYVAEEIEKYGDISRRDEPWPDEEES